VGQVGNLQRVHNPLARSETDHMRRLPSCPAFQTNHAVTALMSFL
jgi:hypothetical protein